MIVSLSPNESSALKARSAGAAAHLNANGPIDQIVQKVVSLAGADSAGAPARRPPAAGFARA